jgi:hypothetical protein
VVASLGWCLAPKGTLCPCLRVFRSPLSHLSLIVFIGSSERAILVRCTIRIVSSGTRCLSYKLVVFVTLGGCHLLDGLVARDSVEARRKIVRGSGEDLCGHCAHPAGAAKSNSSKARLKGRQVVWRGQMLELVAWRIPILRVDVRHPLRV